MSDTPRRHTGLASCTCVRCDLIRCRAVGADWDGWKDVEFAGWARITLFRLTEKEPPVWPGPQYRWEGCLDWFRVLGQPLDFEGAEAMSNGATFPPMILEEDSNKLQTYAEMPGAREREERGEGQCDLWPAPVIEVPCEDQRKTAVGTLQKTLRWFARTIRKVFLAVGLSPSWRKDDAVEDHEEDDA
jgi:hypothetical protein